MCSDVKRNDGLTVNLGNLTETQRNTFLQKYWDQKTEDRNFMKSNKNWENGMGLAEMGVKGILEGMKSGFDWDIKKAKIGLMGEALKLNARLTSEMMGLKRHQIDTNAKLVRDTLAFQKEVNRRANNTRIALKKIEVDGKNKRAEVYAATRPLFMQQPFYGRTA